MSAREYRLLGEGEPETFRCRVYDSPDPWEARRAAFVELLSGPGVLDCPAYEKWVKALQERGWLDASPELERNPDGPGRVGRWRLNDRGRREWRAMKGGAA